MSRNCKCSNCTGRVAPCTCAAASQLAAAEAQVERLRAVLGAYVERDEAWLRADSLAPAFFYKTAKAVLAATAEVSLSAEPAPGEYVDGIWIGKGGSP